MPGKIGSSYLGNSQFRYDFGYFDVLNPLRIVTVNTNGFNNTFYPSASLSIMNGIKTIIPSKIDQASSVGTADFNFKFGYFKQLYFTDSNLNVKNYTDSLHTLQASEIAALQVAAGAPEQTDQPVYLAVTHYEFSANDIEPNREELKLYYSIDGTHFGQLIADSIFKNPHGSNRTADVSIAFWKGYYWVAYNPRTPTYTTSTHFGIVKSKNLVNWTLVDTINVPGATSIWYPNFFYDADKDTLFLTANISFGGGRQIRMFKATSDAGNTWWPTTGTQLLVGISGNDAHLTKIGSTYHLLYSHLGLNNTIVRATSNDVWGSYTNVDTLNQYGDRREGCTVFQLPDGGYRFVVDTMKAPLSWWYADSYDTLQTFTDLKRLTPEGTGFGGIHFLRLDNYENLRDIWSAKLHDFATPKMSFGNFPQNFYDSTAAYQNTKIGFQIQNSAASYTRQFAYVFGDSVATHAEVKVEDSGGNVTTISPHKGDEQWYYMSENDTARFEINMFEVIKAIEKMTGKRLLKVTKK